MSKQITFEFENKTYTLEFTKRTVKQMEANGFDSNALGSKPQTMIPMLFRGAFLARHQFINDKIVDRIFEAMPDKVGLIEVLGEMYNEPMLELLAEPEEEGKNVVKWEKNWK